MKNLKCWAVATLAAATATLGAAPTELRGYGKVEAEFTPGTAEFRCESAESADRVQAKLIRDLCGLGARSAVYDNGLLKFPDGRNATIGRRGNSVVVRDGANRAGLAFPAPKPYPVFLDFFDLRAQKYYCSAMQSFRDFGIENHWPFAKKHSIEGLVFHGLAISETPAAGIENFTPMEFELEAARKADGLVVLCPTIGGALPLWLYNQGPENTAKPQDSTVVTEWQHGVDSGNYEGYGPGFDPAKSPIRAYQKQVMEHFKDHPNLGGWQLYRGAPIGDQMGRGLNGVLWDASPGAAEMFRRYLRERYSLAELGKRWHGDEKFYPSWDRVEPPQLMDLIGGDYDGGRLLLSNRQWEWSPTPAGGYEKYPATETRWVKFHFPPSRELQFLDIGSACYRLRNLPAEWLKGRTGKKLYLKAVGLAYDDNYLQAWVNGKLLKFPRFFTSGAKMAGVQIPPGTLRGDGNDEIIIQTPVGGRHDGRIHGPISISERAPENFPYTDRKINARYLDISNFEADRLVKRNLDMFRYARRIDPDRPMSLSGASWELMGKLLPFFGEQGISMQSTSIDAFYWPQIADWGRLYGFYFVGEPSQPLNPGNFDHVYGQQFYMGTGGTAIFMDLEQYMTIERETGLMSKRAPLLRLLGHYLIDPPKIAQLSTTQTFALGGSVAYDWNLIRGELQSAHYSGMMITESELMNGKITPRTHPVVMDSSDTMTDETVEAIRRYAEAGGTFLATPLSGRHSELERNARPLAKISGFQVEESEKSGKLTFLPGETLFPEWAGKTIDGNGDARDWKQRPASAGARLTPIAPDAEIVATWADGSPAIGVRKIGKGRIVTLGSGFYRNARDLRGKWLPNGSNRYLADLFRQLGQKPAATADSEKIWVRKATVKTGTEDWLIAVNVAEHAPYDVKAKLEMRLDRKPDAVFDAVTGQPVPFTCADGKLILENIDLPRYATRIFSIPRTGSTAGALKFWWEEKLKYWKRGPAIRETDPAPTPVSVLNIDRWQFRAAGQDNWREARPGSWKILFPDLKEYRGEATYRTAFKIPENWRGRSVNLKFRAWTTIYDSAEFFLNGQKIGEIDRKKLHPELNGINAFPVGKLLRFDNSNTLEVKVNGGSTVIAGIAGNVFLETERLLKPEQSLNGQWDCFKADYLTRHPVTLPGRAHGRFLRRTFDVPADWKGKNVFLRLDTPSINLSAVVINGRGKGQNGAYPPFGNKTEINVTEFLKFGETNTIELWHRHTIPTNYIGLAWKWPHESNLEVSDIAIGPAEKE